MLAEEVRNDKPLIKVKKELSITWEDEETEERIKSIIQDAVEELNFIVGADVDYVSPGQGRRLFLNYVMYAWNNCLDEFEDAYRKQIIRLRHYYSVKKGKSDEQEI